MKKQSIFAPLVFGLVFLILGIAMKQYLISALFGAGPIIIFIILSIQEYKKKKEDKKIEELMKGSEEYKKFSYTSSCMITIEDNNKVFRCLSVNPSDNQPYEECRKYIEIGSKKITVYEKPRKITFSEFIRMADEKYHGIAVLYEGINEDNWRSYLDAERFRNKSADQKKALSKELSDSSANRYVFRNKDLTVSTQYDITALVAVSEFFIEKGFVFIKSYAGGGIDEITHTGDESYSAEYTDFDDFRNNFKSDFLNTEKAELYNCGGWVTSLNYGYVDVRLERDELSVNITSFGNSYILTWGETSENIESLKKECNDMILNILGNNFYHAKYA